eukprot:TRINITY_DN58407_c0_g1_i3.p2 TRINITY_DN58407_c0_g1~~TRINITY_DN58407_c0_g1_i3.p2  ORF type:complete len:100 (+),score=6.32 TRINITY_DN58407_c0_g1_i3:57-356(+)
MILLRAMQRKCNLAITSAMRCDFATYGSPFLHCENLLTTEERDLQEQVRSFAQKEIAVNAAAYDREDRFPRELWPVMGALGILGPTAPAKYGLSNRTVV